MMPNENGKVENNISMPVAKNVIGPAYKMLFSFKYNFTRIMHNNCIDPANTRATIAKKIKEREEDSGNGVNIVSPQYRFPKFSLHGIHIHALADGRQTKRSKILLIPNGLNISKFSRSCINGLCVVAF
jgi:hypothetical protein